MKLYLFGVDCEEDGWKFLVKMPANLGGGYEIWGLEEGRNQYEYPITSIDKKNAENYLSWIKTQYSLFEDPCDHGLLEDIVIIEFSAEGEWVPA